MQSFNPFDDVSFVGSIFDANKNLAVRYSRE